MTKRITTITALAATSILAASAQAGVAAPGKSSKSVKEVVTESCISGNAGFDVVSAYYFHGINLQDSGFIIQPYANLSFKVYEGSGFLNSLSLDIGIWNSFHDNRGVGSSTSNWFEFDFTAGITATLAEKWTLGVKYIKYESPGDYFANADGLGVTLGYNDSDLLGAFALNPYVYVEFELEGKSGNGIDEGIYYEVGIAPGHSWGDLSVSVPIKVGFGSGEYYAGDEGYGFFSAGLAASYKLGFIPECLGDWSLSASATYYHLGDGVIAANDGEENAVVFTGGLKVAF